MTPTRCREDGIRDALVSTGACLVENFPVEDNAALLALAGKLGEPVPDTRMPSRAMENATVYRVEEDPENTDEHAYSATSGHFPLHTDCAHFPKPPQIMMLLCVTPSTEGGDTLLAHVDDVVNALSDDEKRALSDTKFPWGDVDAPILWTREGRWFIRYNHATLLREMSRTRFSSSWSVTAAFGKLGSVMRALEEKPALRVKRGDLLVVHNRRVLHGRTAFPSGSTRLLKRMRVRAEL